jgi:hypothetical protein
MMPKKKLKKLHFAIREFESARGKTIEYILVEIIYTCCKENPGIALDAIQLYHNWLVDSADIDVDWFDVEDGPVKIIPLESETETDD